MSEIAKEQNISYKFTAKDYIQDGLVALWDGIENVGWRKHDSNATVWKDLSNNGFDLVKDSPWQTYTGRFVWSDNSIDRLEQHIESNLGFAFGLDFELSQKLYMMVAGAGNTFEGCASRITTYQIQYARGFAYQLFYMQGHIAIGLDHDENGRMRYAIHGPQTASPMSIVPSGAPDYADLNHATFSYARSGNTYVASVNGGQYVLTKTFTLSDKTGDQHFEPINPGGGRTHCLRIYNRALTTEEAVHNYEIDKKRFKLT